MTDHNPELVKAWNDYIGPWHEGHTPDQVMPAWNAFKAGWEARFKLDLAMEKARDL